MLIISIIVCGILQITLLIIFIIILRSLISRISTLESVIIEIYEALLKSYKFSLIHSTHINELLKKVTQNEIDKEKPTIN